MGGHHLQESIEIKGLFTNSQRLTMHFQLKRWPLLILFKYPLLYSDRDRDHRDLDHRDRDRRDRDNREKDRPRKSDGPVVRSILFNIGLNIYKLYRKSPLANLDNFLVNGIVRRDAKE